MHAAARFDVAAAQTVHLVTGFGQSERVKRPLRIDRHRVEVAVQQQLGRTAFGHQVHTSLAQVLELGGEPRGLQLPGRVLHDGIVHVHGLGGLRGVARHQRPKVFEDCCFMPSPAWPPEAEALPWILMKPAASSALQLAFWA